MFMPKDIEVDWSVLKARKQERIAKSNARENSKKENKKYSPGDWITVEKPGILRKLCVPRDGPYQVIKHHDNGMVTFEKEPFEIDKVNQRRVWPYTWRFGPPTRGEGNT